MAEDNDAGSQSSASHGQRRSSLRRGSVGTATSDRRRRATFVYPPEELERVYKLCTDELRVLLETLDDPSGQPPCHKRTIQDATANALTSDDSILLLKVLSGSFGWDESTWSFDSTMVPGGSNALRLKDALVREVCTDKTKGDNHIPGALMGNDWPTSPSCKNHKILHVVIPKVPDRRGSVPSQSALADGIHNPLGLRSLPLRATSVFAPHLSLQYRSLFLFSPNPATFSGRVRLKVFHITDSVYFERAVLVTIIVNSLTLGLEGATQGEDDVAEVLSVSEWVFQALFTAEMLLKMVALGFAMHPGAYLRSSWNVMDFIVVMAGFLSLAPAVQNYSVLRLLRVVRPLRVVNRVPQMKSIMNALVQSLPGMRDVFLLLAFLVVMFAIVGVQLFRGTSHQRCYFPITDTFNTTFSDVQNAVHANYSVSPACGDGWCRLDPEESYPCSTRPSVGRQCASDYSDYAALKPECRVVLSLYKDSVLNFDNFLSASLVVFKVISLDDWPLDMVNAQYASGWGMWIYFLLITLFGGFFCINLFLAVLSLEYYRAKVEADVEEDEMLRQEDDEAKVVDASPLEHFSLPLEEPGKRPSVVSRETSNDHLSTDGSPVSSALLIPQVVLMKRNSTRNIRALRHSTDRSSLQAGSDQLSADKIEPQISIDNPPPPMRKSSVVASVPEISEKSALAKVQLKVKYVVQHAYFGHFMLFVTCFNVLVMALDHHDPQEDMYTFISWASFCCSIVFIAEMLAKWFGLGLHDYFTEEYVDDVPTLVGEITYVAHVKRRKIDAFNSFDCLLVAVSIPEMVLTTGEGGSDFSAFRIFRLARILRLVGNYPTLRQLLSTIIASVVAVAYLFLIMLLFIYISAILGLQLFKDAYPTESRANFRTLWESAVTVFIVITGESWATIMQEAMQGSNAAAFLYFVLVYIFGNYMLTNLFIAILIDEFMRTKEMEVDDDPEEANPASPGEIPKSVQGFGCDLLSPEDLPSALSPVGAEEPVNSLRTVPAQEAGVLEWLNDYCFGEFRRIASLSPEDRADAWDLHGESLFFKLERTHPLRLMLARYVMHPVFNMLVLLAICANVVFLAIERPDMDESTRQVTAIGDFVFTVLFAIECIMKVTVMGLYAAKSPAGVPKAYLTHMADRREGSDYSSGSSLGIWNRLDMFVVITAFAGIGIPQLKLARSLRTVRLVVHFKGIRVVIMALFSALAGLANVALVCFFLWLTFGIMAVQLFKGTFFYCNDPTVDHRDNCTGVFEVREWESLGMRDVVVAREWLRLRYHFDNLAASMQTLFEVAVGEGWAVIMFSGIDARGVDLNPQRNANPHHALFFCAFVVVGQFFALNLFIGMLVHVFSHSKAEEDGSMFMTSEQREWVRANKMIQHMRLTPLPSEPLLSKYCGNIRFVDGTECPINLRLRGGQTGTWSHDAREDVTAIKLCGTLRVQSLTATFLGNPQNDGSLEGSFRLNGRGSVDLKLFPVPLSLPETAESAVRVASFHMVVHPLFDTVITILIICNIVLMCCEHYDQPRDVADVLFIGNWAFVCAFTLELLMKQLALGVNTYFRDYWNRFDFVIVCVSYLGTFLGGPGLSVLRVLRIGRVFRLVKRAKNLQKLFGTLIHALPSLGNVSLLLVITFFIFGVVGVELFGKVTLQGNSGLTAYTNFKNVPYALITLYQYVHTP